jgi:PAS domain S-box-containing protein
MSSESLDPELLQLVLDGTVDWETLTDAEGHVVYSSPAGERMLSLTHEALRSDMRLFWERVHPDDVDPVRTHEHREERGHMSGQVTYRYRALDGSYRWIAHSCAPLFSPTGAYVGQRGSNRDVTDIKHAEMRAAHRARMQAMLTNLSNELILSRTGDIDALLADALARIGEATGADRCFVGSFTDQEAEFAVQHMWSRNDGIVVLPVPDERTRHSVLPWSCAMLKRREAVIIRSIDDLPDDAAPERELITRMGIQSILIAPMHAETSVNGGLALSVYSAPVFWSDDVIDYLRLAADLLSDILEQKRQEGIIERQTTELRDAFAALEVSSRVKDEFLTTVSHELRTPLTTILGLSEALQMQPVNMTDKQLRFIALIRESGDRLLELIEDILDVSEIEIGSMQLVIAPVTVDDVVHAALRVVRVRVQQKGQHLSAEIEPRTLVIDADGRRLRQMIVNLLTNAVKFTPDGGTIAVRVVVDDDPAFIRISIADSGIGISSEDRARLFTPFTRLDEQLTRRTGGAGLGLLLTRRLVEMHGGTIAVESTPGVGSTFTLRLPREQQTARSDPSVHAPSHLRRHGDAGVSP